MHQAMRSLWIVLLILFATLLGRAQNNTATEMATGARPGTAIKLTDPHPNLPNQLLPADINNPGEIVGHIGDERNEIGFIRSKNGVYTEFVFPGQCTFLFSSCTFPMGVNDRGQIVGFAVLANGSVGFLRERNGTLMTLPSPPGSIASNPNSINDRGDIVGSFTPTGPGLHGFLLRKGTFTTIDFPGALSTACTGINNSGLITGFYIEDGESSIHGFLWQRGQFIATFQVLTTTGPKDTSPAGINDRGQVVGDFPGGAFVRDPDGTIHTIDLATLLQPIGGSGGTVTGINNRGDLVGSFGPNPREIFGFLILKGAGSPR